jgi:transcriptional regulator with XRE-family HTH domain
MAERTVAGPTDQPVDPSVYRRRLRNILRRKRESLGIIQADVAKSMHWSISKLIRIETGQVSISVNDLTALLRYYQLTDPAEIEHLTQLAENARKHSVLSHYRGVVSDSFLAFLGHEESAVRSYNYQPTLVPGLLQTDEYAEAVLSVTRGPKTRTRIDGLVELRVARQERIRNRANQFELHYLLDESVVRRVVGSPAIMIRQLQLLMEACEYPNHSVGIIPFSAGLYRSIRVPFIVLEFDQPEDDAVLYLEYPQGEELIREDGPFDDQASDGSPATVPPTYLQIFTELKLQTSAAQTRQILESARKEMATQGT